MSTLGAQNDDEKVPKHKSGDVFFHCTIWTPGAPTVGGSIRAYKHRNGTGCRNI